MYIHSSSIKMYPSGKRNDNHDRNARLNSEKNLISTVNRLTSKKAVVIDGLTVNYAGNKLYIEKGSCNIYGYLFNLVNSLEITSLSGLNNKEGYIVFSIKVTIKDADNGYYTELICEDTSKNEFTGLNVEVINKSDYHSNDSRVDEYGNYIFYLPIAEYNNKTNKWEHLISNDGWFDDVVDERHRWNTLKIKASDIQVDGLTGLNTGKYYTETQDLTTFLRKNYIIDDGRID